MGATFVITLREAFEAALLLGIVYTYLDKVGARDQYHCVTLGGVLGVVASVLVGVAVTLLSGPLLDLGPDLIGTAVLFVAVVVLTWHGWWMRQHARAIKGDVQRRVEEARAAQRLWIVASVRVHRRLPRGRRDRALPVGPDDPGRCHGLGRRGRRGPRCRDRGRPWMGDLPRWPARQPATLLRRHVGAPAPGRRRALQHGCGQARRARPAPPRRRCGTPPASSTTMVASAGFSPASSGTARDRRCGRRWPIRATSSWPAPSSSGAGSPPRPACAAPGPTPRSRRPA